MYRHDIIDAAENAVYAGSEAEDWNAYKLPRSLFVVWAVLNMQGITDNGGFEYFFKNDWPDNPPYSIFVDALREIGASEAADCLQKAVDDFSFDAPHLLVDQRRAYLESSRSASDEEDSVIDNLGFRIIDLHEDTISKLEDYIKRNPTYFPGLPN